MEWKNYISRKKRIRNQKRQKRLEEADINIPLLIKYWPSSIIEIIKHVEHNELIRLRSVSTLMKSYVDQEIKIRRQNGLWNWLSYNEINPKSFMLNDVHQISSQYFKDHWKYRKYLEYKWFWDNPNYTEKDEDDIEDHDKRMIQDFQIDLQLNPKLKYIKM